MKEVRQETKEIAKKYRGSFVKSLLMIVFINAFLSNLFSQSALMSFLVSVLLFMFVSAFQVVILETIKNDSKVTFNDTIAIVKLHGFDLLLLGLMVQMVSYILSSLVMVLLTSVFGLLPESLVLIMGLLIAFLSMAVSYMVTYMFLFAPYYIKDKDVNAFDAFRDSYQDTKGLKRKMLQLEVPYLLFLLGMLLVILALVGFTNSEFIAAFGLIFISVVGFYVSVDLLTVRTVYYIHNKS